MLIAEKARRCEGLVRINNKDVWQDIKKFVTDMEYTAVASGETDSFDITLTDRRFINEWAITKGMKLDAKMQLINWLFNEDYRVIDFGEFTVDRIKVTGVPVSVQVQSLALPPNGTKNTQKWENISTRALAQEICTRLGCELEYYTDDITIKSKQQNRQADIDFLYSVCKEYGFGMKAYRNKIVIFSREAADAAECVNTFDIGRVAESYDIDDNQEGTYTGVQCNYKNDGSDNTSTYTYGGGDRILVLDISAASAKEAELKGKASLYDANMEAIKLKFTMLGGIAPIYAGTNQYITGLGVYSGKYAIDKITHSLSGKKAYRMAVEAHAVDIENGGT